VAAGKPGLVARNRNVASIGSCLMATVVSTSRTASTPFTADWVEPMLRPSSTSTSCRSGRPRPAYPTRRIASHTSADYAASQEVPAGTFDEAVFGWP
jgi:hypothetical protein